MDYENNVIRNIRNININSGPIIEISSNLFYTNKIYKNDNIIFIPLNITSDKLPNSNLMICRDCLIHLSFKNIKLFLENFRNSNINYLLLTSYKLKDSSKVIKNIDITDGEFREIDLSVYPFNLPEPLFKILDKDEQTKTSGYFCYLNLYSKKQIQEMIN